MSSTSQRDLETFFAELIATSSEDQDISLSTDVEVYVLGVVTGFFSGPDVVDRGVVLKGLLQEALDSKGIVRREYLRITGDIALFITGVFPNSISRKTRMNAYKVGDYIDIGRSAYHHIDTHLYGELAFKFPEIVDVLNSVSEELFEGPHGNLAKYIERRIQIDERITRR